MRITMGHAIGSAARWRSASALAALLVLVSACASSPSGQPAASTSAQPAAGQSGPKSLTISLPIDPTSLSGGLTSLGLAAVPSRYFREFTNAYLTTYNPQDEPVPWLVTSVPSLDDGTWQMLDDGRMQVTWHLRPGITWQDGSPLTSDDLAFSWQIGHDQTTNVSPQGTARYVESVDTPDPLTAVFTWPSASQLGAQAGVREFDVLPRHVLDGLDHANLADNAYFHDPASFIGSGPYRALAWDHGRTISLQAYDNYFLGRPKIDRVTFTIISDPQAALANVLANQVDISYWTVSFDGARILQQQWAGGSGGGTVEMQANNARQLLPQLRPEYASPRDLVDVRVRKALMYAMDRSELAETAAPGAAQVVNSTTYPDSDLGRVVEARAVQYTYDPTQAAALFADAGWQKGADGILTKNGERFQLVFRAGVGNSDANLIFPVMQQQYQHNGIDLQLDLGESGDLQNEATFPGMWFTALPDNQAGFLSRFNGALVANAQNHWAGSDRNGYANPAADELLKRVDLTLRRDERMQVWAEANRILVDEVAYMPLYNYPYPYVVSARVRGATPGNPINPPSYFVHAWDMQ